MEVIKTVQHVVSGQIGLFPFEKSYESVFLISPKENLHLCPKKWVTLLLSYPPCNVYPDAMSVKSEE